MGNSKSLESNEFDIKYSIIKGYSQDTLHQILIQYWFRKLLHISCLQDITNIINHYAKWDLLDSENLLKIEYINVKTVSTCNNTVYYHIFLKTFESNHQWQLSKTYSQFTELYNKLKDSMNEKGNFFSELPFFPKDSFMDFMNQKSDTFLENRRALLNNFIKEVKSIINARFSFNILTSNAKKTNCQCIIDFFTDNIVSYEDINDIDMIKFPKEQKVHRIDVTATRKMTDYVLYQILVSDSETGWTVLKRFEQFTQMDSDLRQFIQKNHPEILVKLPVPPPKKIKMFVDHFEDDFIEERRVLMENYLQKLLKFPVVFEFDSFLLFCGAY